MTQAKTLLLLGAGIEQALAIRAAHKLGLKVVAVDGSPEAVGLSEADVAVVSDIRDTAAMLEIGREYAVDGVFTHGVEIPDVVAGVAAGLGLPGLDPAVARRAKDKRLRIARLTECGVPTARYKAVADGASLAQAADEIGYPLVLKPVDNAGARGVRLVSNVDELHEAYAGALQYTSSGDVLLEEVIDGPQISTEAVVYEGKIHTFAFADRNYSGAAEFLPYFVEDGIDFPSALSREVHDAVIATSEQAIRCLGIDFGAAKGDMVVHEGMPKVIEMAARTSGGWFGAGSIPIATGSDMLPPLIQMAVGLEPDLEALTPTRELGCAQRYVIPRQSGTVVSVSGAKEAAAAPGVAMSEMFLPKVGQEIRKATNHAERYGQVICTGATREEAVARCEAAVAMVRIEVR